RPRASRASPRSCPSNRRSSRSSSKTPRARARSESSRSDLLDARFGEHRQTRLVLLLLADLEEELRLLGRRVAVARARLKDVARARDVARVHERLRFRERRRRWRRGGGRSRCVNDDERVFLLENFRVALGLLFVLDLHLVAHGLEVEELLR